MHPCCGGSLQTGTKIIAIIQLVFSIIFVGLGVLAILTSATLFKDKDQVQMTEAEKELLADAYAEIVFSSTVLIVLGVLSITLSSLLLSGANKRNHTRCMIWFVVKTTSLVMNLLGTFAVITSGGQTGLTIGLNLFGILIGSYFLWIVWAFMAELKRDVEVAFYGNPVPRV